MDDKEKILKYLDFKGLSKNSFYTKTGLSIGFLDKGSSLGVNKLKIVIDNYPDLNLKWFFDDNEPMILRKVNENIMGEPSVEYNRENESALSKSNKGIPLIPIDAFAGFTTGSLQVMDYEAERYVVPEFTELKVDFMIRIKGSSMQPKYSSGDLVACKKLNINDIFFQWNKVYVLDTDQGALIKRVKKGKDEHHILLVSDNTNYDPFELHLSSIHAIAFVVGVIRLE